MWISIEDGAEVGAVKSKLQALGLWTRVLKGRSGAGLIVDPGSAAVSPEVILAVAGVADVSVEPSAHPGVDASAHRPVVIAGRVIGGGAPLLMAGPCSVESEAQIHASAQMVARAGAAFLRGGAFKPRTSPYAFCGTGREGLSWMRDAADAHGLGVITEVLGEGDVEEVAACADLLQIGARNMQNFALLRAIGATGKPTLLKRGMGSLVDEWLLAAEHLLAAGGGPVIFCERGIRGFEPSYRNVLDLSAVALLKHVHGQIVVVDPSHAAGRRDLSGPLSRAALAVGADGLLVEAHPDPAAARSDGPQALHAREREAIGQDVIAEADRRGRPQSRRAAS